MPFLILTDKQRESAVGVFTEILVRNLGSHIQTGIYAGRKDWIYISWQTVLNSPTRFAYIGPDGQVIDEVV